MTKPTVLTPARATDMIRDLAANDLTTWIQRVHFKDRLNERGLIIADVRNLMKTGYVYDDAEASSQDGFWKYKVEGKTPNSHNRSLVVVIIPDFDTKMIKFITIFWKDE
jgi:hypothetical protein